MRRPLVIGYGNPLREDDGVGIKAAELIEERFSHEAVKVITARQLTPELAVPVAEASMVIFLDAEAGATPSAVRAVELSPVRTEDQAWTHHATPQGLLEMVRTLSGSAPRAFLVTGATSEPGWSEALSFAGEATARSMCTAAVELLNN